MVANPEGRLKAGARALIGNRGYRRHLKTEGFRIDPDKVRAEEKHDGIRVLRTNTALPMREVALRCVGARLPITMRRIDDKPANGKKTPALA